MRDVPVTVLAVMAEMVASTMRYWNILRLWWYLL
jgi:hypothetical protein